MKLNTLRAIALGTVLSMSAIASVAYAANPMVGGAPMSEKKNIILASLFLTKVLSV